VTNPAELTFWASAGLILYSYALYPVFLLLFSAARQTWRDLRFLRRRANRRTRHREETFPRVAMLVSAFNEEAVMAEKLRNCAAIVYPPGQLEVLLGLDAPADRSAEIAGRSELPNLRLFPFTERRGKLAVLCDLAARTDAEILVFSDANTMLEPDAVQKLVRHFAHRRVGAVCGELRVVSGEQKAALESAYWRYEVTLKFLENRLNSVLGANGAVYAVRRELFRMEPAWIIEDFLLPMDIRFRGWRVVYDPEAMGTEEAAPSFAAEFQRKVRIGAGDFQALFANPRFLNPLRGPAWAYLSHKALRWLGPFLMLAALLSCGWLALAGHRLYQVLFLIQAAFYFLAAVGYVQRDAQHVIRVFSLPCYFTAMNAALFFGFFRFLRGGQAAVWSATPRTVVAPQEKL
jgi:cellulose synthase/poly-beta-1,6-N-acetylglucosamine synthase-like glycosyltransferase